MGRLLQKKTGPHSTIQNPPRKTTEITANLSVFFSQHQQFLPAHKMTLNRMCNKCYKLNKDKLICNIPNTFVSLALFAVF